jgi:hypothetical protein
MITIRGLLFLVLALGLTALALEYVDGASTQVIVGWVMACIAAWGLAVVEIRGVVA